MAGETAATKGKTLAFEAEVKQLLDIVVNSLYSQKEVFLRELISNASDALDKLRLLSLTDPTALGDDPELKIWIDLDTENKTLTISDNGVGMSYDEVIENIGTIARSGTAKFTEYLKTKKSTDDPNLIGRFGVGFYSAFMVADTVTLLTRGYNQSKGVRWESNGDGTYQIDETEKTGRGTDIIIKLRDFERDLNNSDEDFLNQYTIERHIQKHCNFISYPIRMKFVTDEPERDEEGKIIEGKTKQVVAEKTLNSIQPIWAKNPKEVPREDYQNFYKQHFHDWEDAAEIIHTRGEGVVEFTGLLFIPSHAPYGLYTGDAPTGPQLYSKNVLVLNDCRELLPDYLGFVRGVLDSPSLSLNISRELLQQTKQLQSMKTHLEKKVVDAFKALQTNERAKYESLWNEYGRAIKGGVFQDQKTSEKLQDLLIFDSSHSDSQKVTLKEYVDRMPAAQTAIYFVTGESRSVVERLPQMEVVREKGIEVLYFLDRVDEFLTHYLREYAGKPLKSVLQGDLDLAEEKKEQPEEAKQTEEKKEEQYKSLLEYMQKELADQVKEVRVSKRLKSSPVCLVSSSAGYSLNMERLMREANQSMFRATRILEVNVDHPVIHTLQKLLDSGEGGEKLSKCCRLLYDQSLLIENDKIEDPVRFSNALWELMVEAYK